MNSNLVYVHALSQYRHLKCLDETLFIRNSTPSPPIKKSHMDKENDWSKDMNKFNPERLSVEYRDGVTAQEPIIPRHHTLTHSDNTGELFLTIGTQFAWDKVNTEMRDEVLGEWKSNGYCLYYNVYVLVNKEGQDFNTALRRSEVFHRELPLALTAIRYGDRYLFNLYPTLDNGLIIVNFMSTYPQLFKQESFGTFSSYSM